MKITKSKISALTEQVLSWEQQTPPKTLDLFLASLGSRLKRDYGSSGLLAVRASVLDQKPHLSGQIDRAWNGLID